MGYEVLMGEKSEGTAIAEKPDEQMPRGGWGDQKMGNPNAHHIGVEMKSAAPLTPTKEAFEIIYTDLAELERELDNLFQKLQPALTPGYHGNDEASDCAKEADASDLIKSLRAISGNLRIRAEEVRIVAKRVEL